MNCHQVLSGACNAGDQCFAVGSVEGIPFTAYAAGCNIVILASNFERVQIIPGAVHNYVRITSLDCSTDTGKIAAAYDSEVCIFEPTPLIHTSCSHGLEYRWVQTGRLSAAGPLSAVSWNLEGTRLLTGGALLQLWHQADAHDDDQAPTGVKFEIGGGDKDAKPPEEDDPSWICVWRCHTATPAYHLAFSPDGSLFATSGKNDRLVKIWYQNKITFSTKSVEHPTNNTELNYGFIYVAHPRALTHLSWRKTSKYMPKGSVGNMLVTSCLDNICRVWAETLPPEEGWGPGAGRTQPHAARHRAHRHKHRFMQRLKHMKTCFHIRRTAQSSKQLGTPIPTLPSTFSVHDFHNNYQSNAFTAGLHFHLAASINAETDIPLVPSMRGTVGGAGVPKPHFILHWLHNKEMHFTLQAETILHDLTRKILDKEEAEESGLVDGHNHTSHHHADGEDMSSANHSHPSLSNTTSINSIATDVTCTHLPDSLDAKIESLLRDWHHSPDLLFSIHPIDGSFLIWQVEWLDEYHPGSFRQAQVSFSTRIPGAFPLGDATTMSTAAALYHTAGLLLHVKQKTAKQDQQPPIEPIVNEVSTPLASVLEEKEENEWPQPDENGDDGENETKENDKDGKGADKDKDKEDTDNKEGDLLTAPPSPVISMVTNHANGTLNLWQLTFADKSKFSTVLSIGHASRASGHRFRVNDITCHPVLPLLLTTSHHNISDNTPGGILAPPTSPLPGQPARDVDSGVGGTSLRPTDSGGFCSELILWRVDAVGPLSRSGGVGELARINSPHPSAFSNVAWIPTLLPSTTLGNLSNSPSACFVASDGESLRVYQAVIDARTLLAEVASSERRHRNANMVDSMVSISTESSTEGIIHQTPLHDRVKIVSQQSTARPGCVIQLDAIADATHDWQNTQLLHVFQEQLITGERITLSTEPVHSEGHSGGHQRAPSLMESELDAMVDLQQTSVFEEPFYIVVLERTATGTTVHMWRLVIASQPDSSVDALTGSMMYVPDSALIQDADENEPDGRKRSVSLAEAEGVHLTPPSSHVVITTTKVCSCELPLPQGVEVIHASPAAGHLSSASIYPACFAPYIITTACSDSTIRFWKCDVNKNKSGKLDYSWKEWEMINKDLESAIDITGQPLNISAAYSGRIACAYKSGRSFTRPGKHGPDGPDPARYVNLCVAVYECESTGGSEWLLEDTIHLRNIHLPRVRMDPHLDLSYLYDTRFLQKKQRITQVLQTLSHEDLRPPRNGETNLSSDSTKTSAGLLAVPSFSTLQSLRKSITENGNTCPLTQKHLVQLDWVSKEDGSHILTVAVGSKVLLFTPVSSDLAQANMKAMKESLTVNRPILRKASSLAAPHFQEEIRWRKLRSIELHTADGLPPLPMQISWVRDGILVVGMDSEMHVYSQWKPEQNNCSSATMHHFIHQDSEDGPDTRDLRDEDLRPSGESRRRLANVASMPHLSRVSSMNLQLMDREAKRRKPNQQTTTDQQPLLDYMPDYGLFEASRMACPVLPQYHPKQLMELLNSGKIRWVKAILAHLVRCLGGSLNSRSSAGDDDSLTRQRGWSRSRTLSVSYVAGAASPLDNVQQIPEELQLDYTEINTVPPLPLWTLLVADKERPGHLTTKQEAKDYNELFDGNLSGEDDLDELLQEEPDSPRRGDRRPSVPERQGLSHFGPRQGRILSRLLTHTHLPGLSSLDQMHLLALADTVSTCKTDFAERFAIDAAKTAISKENLQGTPQGDDVGTEALDDCGLRFLLAMKHYGYLLRCLPLGARAPLQRQGVGSANIAWAFHSDSAEQLLMLAPGYAKSMPKWATLKELGVGWWMRSPALLRTCIERVARAAYKTNQDPMDAALYYLAMRKKALLWGLFRSRKDEKMTTFFSNNFNEARWRKAAKKNAYALLGRQRFEHAAAFFLLGDSLKDALEVILTRLNDLQLAMVVARLYDAESQMPDSYRQLLFEEILGCEKDGNNQSMSRAHPDPFLRSMALWMMKDFSGSLSTLLIARAGQLHPAYDDNEPHTTTGAAMPQADPNVFNFYVYLRTHPLLVRQYIATQGGGVGLLQEGEEGITRLERRLYFTTAHGHFKAGCPALALEVLSKLPSKILDDHAPPTSPAKLLKRRDTQIDTGILEWDGSKKENVPEKTKEPEPVKSESLDWGAAPSLDWGSAPKAISKVDDDLVLTWDDDEEKGSEGSETPPLALKLDNKDSETKDKIEKKVSQEPKTSMQSIDIMAQQLKFVACLKILMEELSTLATGFEVDGGHLRYQLYIWLEREVEALRQLCGYSSSVGGTGGGEEPPARLNLPDLVEALMKERERDREPHPPTERPTLHQVLLQEKADFEAKVQRAVRRKRWLKANETLLRTLLSYCSLQGAGGGGLASVRMELVLLLQELQQDKGPQQLLSPLPFPTTLPLLSASVACSKTVVADPVRHLQSQAHDMLQTMIYLPIPIRNTNNLAKIFILRDLAVALSACIYQSLCDSDTFSVKHSHPHHDPVGMESLAKLSGLSAHGSHLMGGRHRRYSSTDEPTTVTTAPNKWPGVTNLRALVAREGDDDTPRLNILLCEAFVACYLALLVYGLRVCDSHLLYRLCSKKFSADSWAILYGGGVKRLLRTASISNNTITLERQEGASVWSSLRAQRARLNMRLLGATSTPAAPKPIKEGRPTYREHFVPPAMSMLSYLIIKPTMEIDPDVVDYDSADSVASNDDDNNIEEEDEEDVFGDPLAPPSTDARGYRASSEPIRRQDNTEHCDLNSYSWCIMKLAILKIAQAQLQEFLNIAGIEMNELAVSSPLVHGALRCMSQWSSLMSDQLSARPAPPRYIPACFPEEQISGPPINKYRCILEKHNTPFNSNLASTAPARRLWNYLVHQELVQDIFIRAIFAKPRMSGTTSTEDGRDQYNDGLSETTLASLHHQNRWDSVDGELLHPVRIIHKEQDSILAFCLNHKTNVQQTTSYLAVSSPREVQEMDITLLLRGAAVWASDECEVDLLALNRDPATLPDSGFLLIQHQTDKSASPGNLGNLSPPVPSTPQQPQGIAGQTGRGASVLSENAGEDNYKKRKPVTPAVKVVLKHKVDNIKRMSAHPNLPLYLTGGQDGSVQLWEWTHAAAVSSPRPPGTYAKVTRVRFSQHGNKFGVSDGDGNLSLWQLTLNNSASRPFFTQQCHNKGISDFVFLGSCSLVATAGHSSESRNVAIWDSLMPQKKSLVVAFSCHETGANCVGYAMGPGLIISGGRKGDVSVLDAKARIPRHRFTAHDSAVKCLALGPNEDIFATGAADGDIKVWALNGHGMVHWFPGEHARSSFFKHIGQGVTQLQVDAQARLFSCGADGTMKVRQLPERVPTQHL